MRVVGAAVFPDFGLHELSDTDLETALWSRRRCCRRRWRRPDARGAPPAMTSSCPVPPRHRHRRGGGAAARRRAARGCPFGACTVTGEQRPGDIRNYAAVSDTPLVLAAVLAVLAVGTLAHVLLTGVRRRRWTWRCSRPWLHQVAGARHGRLGGQRAGRRRAARRDPARGDRRALGLGVFAGTAGVASQATVDRHWYCSPSGHAAPRQRHRRLARLDAARLRPATVLRASDGSTTPAGIAAVSPPGWCRDRILAMTTVSFAPARRRPAALAGAAEPRVLLGRRRRGADRRRRGAAHRPPTRGY